LSGERERAHPRRDDPVSAFPEASCQSATVLHLRGSRQRPGVTYLSLGHLPHGQLCWEASRRRGAIGLAGRDRAIEPPPRVGKPPVSGLWAGRGASRLWTCRRLRAAAVVVMQRDLGVGRGCSGGHAINRGPPAGSSFDLLHW